MSKSLSLPKELIINTVHLVHLQSTLMILASKRDFSFKIPAETKLKNIRYPDSFRTTMAQASSDMYRMLSDTHSKFYSIKLAVERIPKQIKIILRILTAGSTAMIQKLLPTNMKTIGRISNENVVNINKTMNEIIHLKDIFDEIKQYTIALSSTVNDNFSNQNQLILYDEFSIENILEKISVIIQQMKKQFEYIAQLIINIDVITKFNQPVEHNIIHFISIFHDIESTAYFLYQLSNIYTNVLNKYVLDQAASNSQYLVLSTDEERSKEFSQLSERLSNNVHEINQLFVECQSEFETNNLSLQQAYEKLFNEFQDH